MKETPPSRPWLVQALAAGCFLGTAAISLMARSEITPVPWGTYGGIPLALLLAAWPVLGTYLDRRKKRAYLPAYAAAPVLLLLVSDYFWGFAMPQSLFLLLATLCTTTLFFSLTATLSFLGFIHRIRKPAIGCAIILSVSLAVLITGAWFQQSPKILGIWYLITGLISIYAAMTATNEFSGYDRREDEDLPLGNLVQDMKVLWRKDGYFVDYWLLLAAVFLMTAGAGALTMSALADRVVSAQIINHPEYILIPLAAVWGALAGGNLAAGLGAKRTLVLNLLMITALHLGMSWSTSLLEQKVLAVCAGFLAGIALAAVPNLASRMAPKDHAAQFAGYLNFAVWLGIFMALGMQPGSWLGWWGWPLVFFVLAMILLQYLDRDRGLERATTHQLKPLPVGTRPWPQFHPEGLAKHTVITRFLQHLARTLAEIFFGKLIIKGQENLSGRAAIVVANHPNTFLDPMLITAIWPGRLHYWAKATLWQLPILGAFLDRLGAIPVYRRQDYDDTGQAKNNRKMMAHAEEKLGRQANILIFPEGVSEVGLHLKPIKTGAARLGFRAMEACRWEEDIPIIPIGLDYAEPTLFRTQVTLSLGEPIWLRDYEELYRADEQEAVRAVTKSIAERLKKITPHLERPELTELVNQVQNLYGHQLCRILGEDDENLARRKIIDAVNHYNQIDGETVKLFADRINAYFEEVDRLGTPENHSPIPFSEMARIFLSSMSFTTFGILSNWLPYRLTGVLIERLQPSSAWMATAKLAFGSLVFGFYYAIVGLACKLYFGSLATLVLMGCFSLSGVVALGAIERYGFEIQRLKTLWQAFWTQDTNDELENMKLNLIQDLEHFREAYFFHLSDMQQGAQE